MGRKGQSITLSMSASDKAHLEQLAREHSMFWGNRPNISRLIEAIAKQKLLVSRNADWSTERINALYQAMQTLTDSGQTNAAESIAELLLERSELAVPIRQQVEQYLSSRVPPWRLEIDQYIHRQIPFQLAYRDAADTPRVFNIRYAQIATYERRQYLECWCEETQENRDLPELKHNWTLRLDRIPDAAIGAVRGSWRTGLDSLDVEIHLLQSLAFAYEAKSADITNEWISDFQARRVVRRIYNTFWFFREVRRYGPRCVVISPDNVRFRFVEELSQTFSHYSGDALNLHKHQ